MRPLQFTVQQSGHLSKQLQLQSQLKHEYGAAGIEAVLARAQGALQTALSELEGLPVDADLARREPSGLAEIQALRPTGPRRLWDAFDDARYADRVAGALLGRFAGCTLGAPVEFWPIDKMAGWAAEIGDAFPPIDYWSEIPERHLGLIPANEATGEGAAEISDRVG